MPLWKDIKERRITQVLLGYIASGWIVLAVFDQLVDRGVLGDVVYYVVLTLFVFGIGIALILGWYHGEKGRQQATPFEIVLLTVVAVGGLVTSTVVARRATDGAALMAGNLEYALDLRDVAVAYFEDASPQGDIAHLADAFTEDLIAQLSRVGELSVVSANGVAPFRDEPITADSMASVLGVGTVIMGTLEPRGDRLRVNVRLVDGRSGQTFARISPEWPADDLLAIRDELPAEVARAFREHLGEELRVQRDRRATSSTPAWLLVQRAAKARKDAEGAVGRHDAHAASEAYALAIEQLTQAAELDPAWPEPLVQRGWVRYELARLGGDRAEAAALLGEAVADADRALALDGTHGDALHLRGTARYYTWLANLGDGARDPLLTAARSDLEGAYRLDPGLAGAYSTLSHLYYQTGELNQAFLAAEQAYDRDAYLKVADGVLWRLYSASYDLQALDNARRWCDEGRRRFPDHFRFRECEIWLMTLPGAQPDPTRAWELVDEMAPLVPESARNTSVARMHMVVAGVIGLAGMADSADAVMRRTREAAGPQSGDLLSIEAAMRTVIGDTATALDLLERYIVANPGHFGSAGRLQWWWQPLRGNQRFERLRSLR